MNWGDILFGMALVVIAASIWCWWFLKSKVYNYLRLTPGTIREFRFGENGRVALRDEVLRRFNMRAGEIMEKLIIVASVLYGEGMISNEDYEDAIDFTSPDNIAEKRPFPSWVFGGLPEKTSLTALELYRDFLTNLQIYQVCLRVAQKVKIL